MLRGVLAGLILVVGLCRTVAAQARQQQYHDFNDPEGRLMAFYAAALAVSAVGPARAERPWSVRAGLELSHIPRLSREQRTAGFDKPESSNLSPVLPRPRLAISTPQGVRIEASWLPPIRVFDARANLYSLAVSRAMRVRGAIALTPRVVVARGRARGAITCNDDLRRGTPSEQVYYGAVCHVRESDDHFEPRQLSAEVIVSRPTTSRLAPFATLGLRRDDTRFDIGVIRSDGRRDPDHPVLLMRATRPFLAAGVTVRGRVETGAEVYYAPGSLLTLRVRTDLLVRRGREVQDGR